MPILPDPPPSFTCVICGRHRENRWPGAYQNWDMPPICYGCETLWGQRSIGSIGTHRDRRLIIQIEALAEAINSQAWRAHHRETGYYERT